MGEAMTDEELTAIEAQVESTAKLSPVQLMWLIAAVRQGHQDLRDCNEDREQACEFERRFEAERDEAQKAAEEYWEAWQESASFCEILAELNEEWRKKVERLECKLDTSRVANRPSTAPP
jgi:hypothetical protein